MIWSTSHELIRLHAWSGLHARFNCYCRLVVECRTDLLNTTHGPRSLVCAQLSSILRSKPAPNPNTGLVCDDDVMVTKAGFSDANGVWKRENTKLNGELTWARDASGIKLLQWKGAQWRLYVTPTLYYSSDHARSPALTGWRLGPKMVPIISCATPKGCLLVH